MSLILDHFRQQSFLSKRLLLSPGGNADGEFKGEERKTGLATHVFSGNASKRDNALVEKITAISGSYTSVFNLGIYFKVEATALGANLNRFCEYLIGPCIKLHPEVVRVFERLHLVFYRTREYSDRPALLEAILAKIGQRTFPTYEISRTNTVFKNRSELLKYEEAIKLHFELSELVESAMGPGKAATVYVRDADNDTVASSGRASSKSGNKSATTDAMTDAETERRRAEVISIYENVIQEAEKIRQAWRDYVETEEEVSKQNPNYFLIRYSPGIDILL